MAETVTVTVGGQRHDGWKTVSITRAIDSLCGAFDLTLSDRWAGRANRFMLDAGAAASVAIGAETVITGFIDKLTPSIGRDQHPIRIAGRDRAGDLVDCSAVAAPGSWRDSAIETIVAELARPFGIAVTARASTGPKLKRFALQQGESVQAAIDRLLRFAGLLAISTPAGGIELIEPASGAPAEAIVEGVNLLDGEADHDVAERFSQVIVKGQASGDDFASGSTVSGPMATATDGSVARYRPLIVIAEEQATIDNLNRRALWEVATRAGRAQRAEVTVNGWRRPGGSLRAPNSIVKLTAPSLFIDGDMLVERVTYLKDDRGEVAQLGLVHPLAWRLLPVPAGDPSRIGKP